MDPAAIAEEALRTVERSCRVTITVRDLAGVLVDAAGTPLVDPGRNSHRRQAVCDRGFSPDCVHFCRTQANAACRTAPAALGRTCWKGVREVVAPLRLGPGLAVYLFAGAWRDGPVGDGPWADELAALRPWDPAEGAAVAALLTLLGEGLLALAGRDGAPAADGAGRLPALVRAHLRDPSPRAALARALGLSPSRVSHLVREACGLSLQDLVSRERAAEARRLLATTDLPVAEVGARVGWSDPPHFTRLFRRLAGTSPGAWRAAHRLA